MDDYENMSRKDLIQRLQALETKLAGMGEALRETTVQESEERLRAVLNTAVEGIVTIDEHGIVESMNPAAERIFGWKAEEVIGKNVAMLMASPFCEEHAGYLANYLRTGKASVIGVGRETVGQHRSGKVFPMDLAVSEVRLGNRRLFTGFIREISERKRLEKELLEISDRERQRIGQDLHDGLCQHLAGIELMSQVLEQKLAPKAKAAAARAGEIARHVREAISQTRLLIRGLSPVTLETEGLTSALQELAANTEKMFGVTCRLTSPRPATECEPAVATHLYRIAQEAVSNAIRHGKATQVLIGLEPAGVQTVLHVCDNGVGLPDSLPEGKGMGLRIMQCRASMIGGVLSLKQGSGGGTTVSCSVPGRGGRMFASTTELPASRAQSRSNLPSTESYV